VEQLAALWRMLTPQPIIQPPILALGRKWWPSVSSTGRRTIKADDFFVDMLTTALELW